MPDPIGVVTVAARLRALEAQATPGPWPADGERVLTNVGEAYPAGRAAHCGRQADAEFIAMSRSLLPLLADLAEAAEQMRRRGHAEGCRWVRGGPPHLIERCDCGAHAWDTALARVAAHLDHEEGTT